MKKFWNLEYDIEYNFLEDYYEKLSVILRVLDLNLLYIYGKIGKTPTQACLKQNLKLFAYV
jgi:hypothetical protein